MSKNTLKCLLAHLPPIINSEPLHVCIISDTRFKVTLENMLQGINILYSKYHTEVPTFTVHSVFSFSISGLFISLREQIEVALTYQEHGI